MDKLVTTNSFGRRSWNKEEYEKLAREKRSKKDVPAAGGTQVSRSSQQSVATNFANLNKVQLAAKSSFVHKGRSAGFYCEVCDLTFKDNLSYLDHINSSRHLEKSDKVEKRSRRKDITVQDVRERIEQVFRETQRSQKPAETLSLKERIEKRKEFERKRAQSRRLKRKGAKAKGN